MYLSELKLWNFRKYGIPGSFIEYEHPGLVINFKNGLNVLVGENDSGKTTIIDAIRYILGTQSGEWIRWEESDFHVSNDIRTKELMISCKFKDLSEAESGLFIEWLDYTKKNGKFEYELNINLTVKNKGNRIYTLFKAGTAINNISIDSEARYLLRVTYLKPLRDADSELTPGKRSRFAQILKSHQIFQKKEGEVHKLEQIFNIVNTEIENYFSNKSDKANASKIVDNLELYINTFFPIGESHSPKIRISGGELLDILQRLSLSLDSNPSGLGATNLLFIATELLLLQSDDTIGPKLALIEELEAHLHPQAQLRLVHYLKDKSLNNQFILTTHSITLGSSIPLDHLIICNGDKVFPMDSAHTQLEAKNYAFLSRFLDATKANLFFTKGVLLVEGDAENLLIPTIAKILNRSLHKYGVSIVNVGSKAFSHYIKIFHRKNNCPMGIRVAMITDMDIWPLEYNEALDIKNHQTPQQIVKLKKEKLEYYNQYKNIDVNIFISPSWTLEYEIALSEFKKLFYFSCLWAEKIENSKSGIPQDNKKHKVYKKVDDDFDNWNLLWKNDSRINEKIAYEIYKKTMIDKKISKAITAQIFSSELETKYLTDPIEVKNRLIQCQYLKYIIEAIYHVTILDNGACENGNQ